MKYFNEIIILMFFASGIIGGFMEKYDFIIGLAVVFILLITFGFFDED